jgi:hypothetical protein
LGPLDFINNVKFLGQADVEVTVTGGPLKPVKCSGGSLESVGELTQNLDGPFAVKEGNIDGEELKGKFISPTEANGTINIVVEFSIFSNSITCDFGTWNWSAKAK